MREQCAILNPLFPLDVVPKVTSAEHPDWPSDSRSVGKSTLMPAKETAAFAWKLARWGMLSALVLALLLMLQRPSLVSEPLAQPAAKEKSDAFQAKLTDLEQAHQRGESAEARFTTEEVNGALQQGLAEQTPATNSAKPELADEMPPIQPAQVLFVGDRVTGQFIATIHGKQVYVTVSGRLGASGGYVTFEPVDFKIGDLPVPVSLVNPKLQSRLLEPGTREKLKLPEYIADLRVEHGQLVVVEK